MVVEVPLFAHSGAQRAVALVDEGDADLIQRFRWSLHDGLDSHAVAWIKDQGRIVYLHRFILGLVRGDRRQVDHINRNKLDCRRSNMRVVTHRVNAQNMPSQVTSTSVHRGVSWDTQTQKWRAAMVVDGRFVHLGRFPSEEEAAAVARDARLRMMPGAVD